MLGKDYRHLHSLGYSSPALSSSLWNALALPFLLALPFAGEAETWRKTWEGKEEWRVAPSQYVRFAWTMTIMWCMSSTSSSSVGVNDGRRCEGGRLRWGETTSGKDKREELESSNHVAWFGELGSRNRAICWKSWTWFWKVQLEF